jgi:hypothetical protein
MKARANYITYHHPFSRAFCRYRPYVFSVSKSDLLSNNTKSCLKSIGAWGALEEGETIHNLRVNRTINTKSVEYRLHIRTGKGQEERGKRGNR